MLVKPSDLIRMDLGEKTWDECSLRTPHAGELSAVEDLSPFQSSKTYFIYGKTGQFEFPALPHGSYCVYVADGRRAVKLTRGGREIESVLKQNWPSLTECNPVRLAGLILKFFDGGLRFTHTVLPGADSLRSYGKAYVVDDREMAKVQHLIGTTSIIRLGSTVHIRAITLCGWMHDQRNLGIEHLQISTTGQVRLDKREVLSTKIFRSVPQLRY